MRKNPDKKKKADHHSRLLVLHALPPPSTAVVNPYSLVYTKTLASPPINLSEPSSPSYRLPRSPPTMVAGETERTMDNNGARTEGPQDAGRKHKKRDMGRAEWR
jgi:hypothetical protein